MTLPRLRHLTDYWAENPPTSIATSAILKGLGGGNKKKRKADDGEYVPQEIPKDAHGFPTKEVPSHLGSAVMAFGGKIHTFKKHKG